MVYRLYTIPSRNFSRQIGSLNEFPNNGLGPNGNGDCQCFSLDEATAAAEAMLMFYNGRSRADVKAGKTKFLIDKNALPQTLDVVKGRSKNLGIELIIDDIETCAIDDSYFGAILQYPDVNGHICDLEKKD